ncbi:MAG: hypothetical protein JNM98_07400 [Rhodocyclaceae bacterium]|nr:hypothetical protein [Rhodocyclaceae bacterium]
MSSQASRLISSAGLIVGSALGMAGTFTPVPVRGLLWGLDGIVLVVAATLLTLHHYRKGNDLVAAGFLTYVAGQTLVLATAPMDLAAGAPLFGTGAGLWAAALFMLSAPKVAPLWVRIAGACAASMFLVVAIRLFLGAALTALSQPLPFAAYPFLVATLAGWAWERYREGA